MLYYNKKVMREAGLDPNKPPKTWDELREMSKIVSQKGKGNVYGILFPGGETSLLGQIIMGLAASKVSAGADGFNLQTRNM